MRISQFVYCVLIGVGYAPVRIRKEARMQRNRMNGIPGDNWPQASSDGVEIGVFDELRIGLQRIREARFSWWND